MKVSGSLFLFGDPLGDPWGDPFGDIFTYYFIGVFGILAVFFYSTYFLFSSCLNRSLTQFEGTFLLLVGVFFMLLVGVLSLWLVGALSRD